MKSIDTKDGLVTYLQRLGHLINVIPKHDIRFKSELYIIIKNNLIKNNIDPNNICFNFDILGEMNKYNSNLLENNIVDSNGLKI